MASSLLSGLFPDSPQELLTALDSLQLRPAADRPQRRPQISELDRLTTRQIRPLVEIGQATATLQVGEHGAPLTLTLDWLERWGGTFGPRSSAAANARRGAASGERFLRRWDEANGLREPDDPADRGGRPAWILYLSCPVCTSRCRVLYSPRGQHQYACPKCAKPFWQSYVGGASGRRNASAWDRRERIRLKHQNAAARILRDYLQHTGPNPSWLAPVHVAIAKPPRMTWARFEALCRLVEAHQVLEAEVQLGQLQASLARLLPEGDAPSEPEPDVGRWARTVLKLDAWALRQRSWHRRGRPRDTPGQGTREKAARLETSTDSSGHAENAQT